MIEKNIAPCRGCFGCWKSTDGHCVIGDDQNGILALERNSGILYSADLFLRFGNGVGQTIKASWPDEVNAIDKQRIPVKAQREKVQAALRAVSPKLVAVGHGFCLDCE